MTAGAQQEGKYDLIYAEDFAPVRSPGALTCSPLLCGLFCHTLCFLRWLSLPFSVCLSLTLPVPLKHTHAKASA